MGDDKAVNDGQVFDDERGAVHHRARSASKGDGLN